MKLIFPILFILLIVDFCYAQQNSSAHPNHLSLKGKWKFALDINDEGLHKKWYMGNLTNTYLGNILYKPVKGEANKFVTTLSDEIDLPGTTDIAGWGMPDQSPWINYLQRKHKYIGSVWYQKIIDIPEDWNTYQTELYLERVKWESRVWVDGLEVGKAEDGLVTAHKHNLGILMPGKHLLAIRIDNRMIHPIGDKGHNYTEQTESIWNGIIGKIELRKKASINIKRTRIFTDSKFKTVTAELNIENAGKISYPAKISIIIKDKTGKVVASKNETTQILDNTITPYKVTLSLPKIEKWSEFQQPLYTAECTIEADGQREVIDPVTFAFRDISHNRYKILINDLPIFIRGNQEALGYPLTGHPPMDKESWKKIFRVYKAHGLNQVRFHSSCPPDAAFQAADELGIYIMVELIWITSVNGKSDLRPISATMGIPKGLGNGDRTLDAFVLQETRKLLDQFGNHPSFCFFAFGNEMDNINKEVVNKWIDDFKKDDPRRLYASTTARAVLSADDFQDSHLVPGKGGVVNKIGNPSTLESYDSSYIHSEVPVIAHELGQVPVYPSWDEIDKYKNTPFRATALEKGLQNAVLNHVDHQDKEFRKASGQMQQLLYKDEIERQFRSRYSAGFNLLQMNDYTGQGEALVGWLDAFYNSKGIVTPEYFRNFCNTVVILARYPKHVYKTGEQVNIDFLVAYNDQDNLATAINWELVNSNGIVVLKGKTARKNLKSGQLESFGAASITFPKTDLSKSYTLMAFTDDGKFRNEWNFWAFADHEAEIGNVIITDDLDRALKSLSEGKKVLLTADKLGNAFNKNFSSFIPVFWSTIFFPGSSSQVLGSLIHDKHPALNLFPTNYALDWQWQNICKSSRGIVLDGEAIDIAPIIQPIDDFHSNRKLATLFEAKMGKGSLMVCGYNLNSSFIEVANLKASILAYMNSDRFAPNKEISVDWLQSKLFKEKDTSLVKKENTQQILTTDLPTGVSLFKINPLKFELKAQNSSIGFIYLDVKLNQVGAEEVSVIIDGRKGLFTVSDKPNVIKIQYFREDFDDQKLQIELIAKNKNTDLKLLGIKMVMDN